MIKRPKSIDVFCDLFDSHDGHIFIIGEKAIGKSVFLSDLESDGIFGEKGHYRYLRLEAGELLDTPKLKDTVKILIVDVDGSHSIDEWRDFLADIPVGVRVIGTNEVTLGFDQEVILGPLSFREYLEGKGRPIEIQKILTGTADISHQNSLKDTYIERGAYPLHLIHPDTIPDYFQGKCTIIKQELFEKEHDQFLEYTRTLAMHVGQPFKADQLAKLLDISRRKVNKYTELLLKYDIVKAIGPWVQNTDTETSRHVKLYFSDLSYLKALLGDTHYHGTQKQGAIENFVFLELYRKLDSTHTISYYRKKSGAEITYILENIETEMLTAIEVTTRETEAISQAFRSFDDDYHDRIERYMLVNQRLAGKKDLEGKPFIVIPHIAI